MLFNSFEFLLFFPIVITVYFVIPRELKHIWLLLASYYFYMCWNTQYAILIFISTAVTYLSGLLIGSIQGNGLIAKKKWIVGISFFINLSILFFFKYSGFAINILSKIFSKVGIYINIPTFDVILPVGISFYTFQALSYTMDVYRGDIYPEKNFVRYSLFVAFFPQLVAGPIERSKNLLKQLAY